MCHEYEELFSGFLLLFGAQLGVTESSESSVYSGYLLPYLKNLVYKVRCFKTWPEKDFVEIAL